MVTEHIDWRPSVGHLSPEEWESLRRETIARAHRLRSEMVLEFLASFAGAVSSGLAALARRSLRAALRWRKVMAARHRDKIAIASLQALDDCALSDIGIRRSEIESIVHARGNDYTRLRKDEKLAA